MPKGAEVFKGVINGFKLSPQQEHLWLIQQTSTALPACAQCVISIEGNLNTNALNLALREVVSRHEILRTVFESLPEMVLPLQVITDESGSIDEKIGLTELSEDWREARVGAELKKMEEEARWRTGLRSKLIALGQRKHLLLVSLPALCSDGTSLKNLVKKICDSYSSILQRVPLSDEPLQYSVISEWLNGLLESEQAAAGMEYWRKLDLTPSTFAALPYQSHSLISAEIEPQVAFETITRDSLQKIEKFAEQYDVSLSEFLLTCWQVLLWRLTGQESITVGVAYDGRTDEDLGQALGLLTKYLPIQIHFNEDMRFDDVLMQLVKSAREADNWQECFAWRHIPDLAERRQLLLFPFGFEFEEWPQGFSLGDVEFSLCQKLVRLDRPIVKLGCVRSQDHLVTEFHYDAGRLSEKQVTRLASEFLVLIDSLLDTPGRRIAEVNIVSDAEKESLLRLNANEVDLAPDYIHRQFERQVKDTPDSTALISEGRQLTYAELNARSNRLAHHLRKLGVKPGAIVAICADRSIEMVIGLLGILKSGGAYLPLDSDYPESRLTFMLEDSQASILLSQPGLVGGLSEGNARIIYLNESIMASAQESEENPSCEVTADSLAYVIYTSGSTGNPKGAMLAHANIVNCLGRMQDIYALDASDRFLMRTSLNFDPSVWELFWPLQVGGAVVLADTQRHHDTAYLTQLIAESEVTSAYFVPSMLRFILDGPLFEACGSLKRVICGGESLSITTMNRFFDQLRAELHHSYGPTETSIAATEWVCRRETGREIVPIGKPLGNIQIYILNAMMQLAPVDIPGELHIGGVCVGQGYLNQPELTAEKFVPDPFSLRAGRRMYRTGDLVRWREDDELEFLGRTDHQVKIRGYRIELGEIEAALNSHTQVKQGAVIIREGKNGDKQLAGYAVGAEGMSPAELKRHLRERLPKYMVPEVIQVLKEMPLSVNGKIDRKRLLSMTGAEQPVNQRPVRARTPVEEMLSGIFEEILKLDQVGIGDNFFELGGHSLLATQVVSRVRKALGVEISVRSIFDEPMVEGLARKIEVLMRSGEAMSVPPPVRISRDRQLPLSFAQQRLWLIEQINPGASLYNCPGAIRLEGRLDVKLLESAVNEVVGRHEVLRTRFEVIAGEPAQVIDEIKRQRLKIEDLTNLTPEAREEEVGRIAREDAETGFDLRQGPMMRVKVLKVGEEEHVLLFTLHHIVSDAWSMEILVREVCELYGALNEGKESILPELNIQYADYACWQRDYLQGEVLKEHLLYWKKQLGGNLPIVALAHDHPRPQVPSYQGAAKSILLSAELLASLKALARQEGATLFMILLAAFKALLYRYTAQEDIIIGTAVANRSRAEIEPLVGFFVNMLPMRTDLSGNPGFRELLERVREVALGAYAHQEMPFERIVKEVQLERAIPEMPLFNIAFGVQNVPWEDHGLAGIKIRPLPVWNERARFDLSLWIIEDHDGLLASWVYSKDLFEEKSIIRMHNHFETLLFDIVDRPDARLTTLEVSPRIETRLVDKERGGQKDLDRGTPMLVKRKGIKLPPETV